MDDNLKSLSRTKTSPIAVKRTLRKHDVMAMTSMPAGKMVPLAFIPLLREDAMQSGRFRLRFESMETAEILMNAINVNVKAVLVPNLAFERFNGLDDLNRAYENEPYAEGDTPIKYIDTHIPWPDDAAAVPDIYKYSGVPLKEGETVNSAYVEAYNTYWNFRAANRSPDITKRARLDMTLAPAFWQHSKFSHIVPDFDQAIIDGEVPLNVTAQDLTVRPEEGLAMRLKRVDGVAITDDRLSWSNSAGLRVVAPGTIPDGTVMNIRATASGMFAELAESGITISLSNIELARKTQAFAALRQQFEGLDDEYILDLLMDGISVPEQMWRQPVLLADKTTIFGMAKRYASDSGNLTESVVNGSTGVDIAIRLPAVPVGGIVMIVAEITPEQIFERSLDVYLKTTTVDTLPHYLRDELDPEKVEVVRNDSIDSDHDTPAGVFGYQPLNGWWNNFPTRVGGKFYRPKVDAEFDEDRQRLWAVETENPVLSEDFYLCTTMHTKPFVVTNQDPFEVVTIGQAVVDGLTVFGRNLIEATNSYEKVLENAPQERIEK